jgi:hypothetical protein
MGSGSVLIAADHKPRSILKLCLNQVPSLGEARATFENDFIAAGCGDNAKGLGDVIVLLNNRRTQLALAKVFRRAEDCLFKIGMLKESQATVSPWLAKQMR